MNKNIVLIGFMGAGKSLTAKCLGKKLQRKVVSTDEEIERREKKSVAQIFTEAGEEHFRTIERQIVQALAQQENLIIDCGGGVVVDVKNIADLKAGGILFYLSTSPQWVYERVKHKQHRPLLNVPDPLAKIRELLSAREPFYRQADHILDTDGKTVEESCQEVLSIIHARA